MCGITGFIDFYGYTTESVLHAMTDVLHHRGPDDSGYYFDRYEKAAIGLGHRRLSVLDLSPHGHQPMQFQDIVISYNGEIYNFKEIREELEKKEYVFDSNTDTEVILKAYHCWGPDMAHRFNGMFAFAIYDKQKQIMLLVRDRAGVKPLFWYFKDGLFLFASELKSFHENSRFQKELNNDGLALYFQRGYIPQPHTIFNDCYKLKGGHYLTVDLRTQQITDTAYWDVMNCYCKPKLKISEQEAVDEAEKLLKSAFEYRMISDVPVGIFLSGGFDSSLVAAVLQSGRTEKLKTFTIGFHEERYNEAVYAKKIADYLGTEHTEYYCTQEDAVNILPRLTEIWDEPFGDSSAIPTVLVSQLARRQVTVSLSADGGDETFAGYNSYPSFNKIRNIQKRIPSFSHNLIRYILRNPITCLIANSIGLVNAKSRLNRLSDMIGCDDHELWNSLATSFPLKDLKALLNLSFKTVPTDFDEWLNGAWLDNILALDYKTYLIDDILTKVDRATMSVSLEGREPLLDYRIIEYIAQLDSALKIKDGDKKYLLKKIAYNYIPGNLLDRPKMGFALPLEQWFGEGILKEYLLYYLDKDRLKKEGIFNPEMVVNLRDTYLSGKKMSMKKLWFILVFQMWKEKWYNETSAA